MKNILLILNILLLLSGCANMVTPTGGKKDETIPKLKKTNLTSTNFKDDYIKMEFDEYIVPGNEAGAITIQPKHTTFNVSNNGKIIRIKFDSSLRKNTTYNLTIANGIKDLNESNPYSLTYIFSTGAQIDTNFVNYKIDHFKDHKNLKIGLNTQRTDSVQKLKFDYLFPITTDNISIMGLGNTLYNCWIFTDKDNNDFPDEYMSVYYDTIHLNYSSTVTLNKWIDSRNTNITKYNTYIKIFKQINDQKTYGLKEAIYIDKDSSLFFAINSDTLPSLDIKKELVNKINGKIQNIKTNKEYITIIDKCGINGLTITDKINYKEDQNFFYINSKSKLDSVNFKITLINDSSLVFPSRKFKYEESNKISTLKINKSNKYGKIIMAVYQNEKPTLIKIIDLKNDALFYMHPGTYKIIFYNTDSFENISFHLENLQRTKCSILEKEIILKPNWDEDLQLIF